MADIDIRMCASDAEVEACAALQAATWGEEGAVPGHVMQIAQKVGGVVAGAFDAEGRMLGCLFGMSGIRERQPVHWSHMLAVVPEARGQGLGRKLKEFQRAWLLDSGVERMFWTYDPLETVNAHFNINRLGARPVEYVQDMYGDGEENLLHRGLGTDRFIVEWDLVDPSPAKALPAVPTAPVVNTVADEKWTVTDPAGSLVARIESPNDIQSLKQLSPGEAKAWRMSTREAFQSCFSAGYAITGFRRLESGHGYYILELNA